MDYKNDKRTVMTLDAGGTNFVFIAIQGGQKISEPISLPSNADNLERCLNTIVDGFEQLESRLPDKPVAISLCFSRTG